MRRAALVVLVLALGAGTAFATDGPDSKQQPPQDGCNRSSLALLGQAFANLEDDTLAPNPFPEWVYVNGDPTPRTLGGLVIATHTAGQDLFGAHKSYDLNVDVVPDAGSKRLLSTRNAQERPPQIHTEAESHLVPLWAWPTTGDRIRETGSWIWDCGHWQEGERAFPSSDLIPGDPFGTAGVEPIGGEETEIHPIAELVVWRRPGSFVPRGASAAVPSSRLDVYLTNEGGGAKAAEECATAPNRPTGGAQSFAGAAGCSQLQKIAGRDYDYYLRAPSPRPDGATLRWQQDLKASHHAPAAKVTVASGGIIVKVPFRGVAASSELQDFGAAFHVWWSKGGGAVRRLRVAFRSLKILNNLDGDAGQSGSNPSITPDGEWNVYVDVAGTWRALQKQGALGDPRGVDLGAIPHGPVTYDLSRLAPVEADLLPGADLRVFVDARDCDLPGFIDCPSGGELDFSQRPGRAVIVLPVSELAGGSRTFTISPQSCAENCPEEKSDPACEGPCYSLTFSVEDVTGRR